MDTDSLPLDRRERARWLAAREDEIARLVRAELRRVVGAAVDAYTSSLTASGDMAAFDGIPGAWLITVEQNLTPKLGEVYQAGQVTAWLGMPAKPSAAFAAQWTAVANQAAVSYMGQATNRLAGVGQGVWKDVRSKAQNAVAKGLTNEQLKDEIQKVTGFSEYRADTIARTETVGAYVQGDLAGARALGDSGPLEKVWVAALDPRTRETHAAAHDQCVPIDATFDVGGVKMDAPHDPSAPPAEVVNCRCIVEFLYAGDTRPDGTTVEAPAGVDAPEDAYDPSRWDPSLPIPPEYRQVTATQGRAQADAAVHDLNRRAGVNMPDRYVTDTGYVDRTLTGTRPGFPGTDATFDPTKLAAADIDQIERGRVVDWLTGDTTQPSQFIRQGYASSGAPLTTTGKRVGGYLDAALSHELDGAAASIERAWAEGRTLASNGRAARDAAIKAMSDVSDAELRGMFRAYADELHPGNRAAANRWLDDLVDRKNALAKDFAAYDDLLDAERAAAIKANAPKPPRTLTPLDGSTGGPKGMAGALDSKADTRWMTSNDSPLTVRADAPSAYGYTRGSASWNTPARAGQVTDNVRTLDAELGTIKSDMIVHRGVTLEGRYPPGGAPALQGHVLVDDGFLSTSAGGRAAFSGDTYLEIRANAGTPGSWVKPISAFPNENEMLLGRSLPLYVHSVTKSGSAWLVQVETVSAEWVAATDGVKTWSTAARAWL